jgi:hypothetical protein
MRQCDFHHSIGSDAARQMLLCDTCDSGWHMQCLSIPLTQVPDGDWYCPDCAFDKDE